MEEEIRRTEEILSYALDGTQVVSYKWLSRNFSISSNEAKRLLQIIVDQHGSRIEVIYVVSGWLKTNQQYYSVKLVPKSKLQEATDVLDGHVSVHVYSIQPSIPTDPAELWAAEYTQSHELFNQDPELNNCLRDNRFSAVTCTSIARKQPRSSDARQKDVPKLSAKSSSLSKCLEKQDEKPTTLGISKPLDKQDNLKFMENHISKPTLNEENDSKAPETDALVRDGSSISLTGSKETSKKKVEGNGLANLWGRASVKPKPISGQADIDSSIKIEVSTPGNAGAREAAKAQPQAPDISFGGSSDDDSTDFMHVRRGQTKEKNRRTRRMVIDDEMSDDGEDDLENVISLSSPDVPIKTKAHTLSVSDKKSQDVITQKEKRKKRKEDTMETSENDLPSLHQSPKQVGDASFGAAKNESHNVSKVKEERNSTEKNLGDNAKGEQTVHPPITKNGASSLQQSGPKKRKVLKTHIDDHGREVTEVVWENENDNADSENKTDGKTNPSTHGDAEIKVSENKTFGNKEPHKPTNKTAGSNVKAGKVVASKDSQQGKIFSFFKKKT